MTAKGLGAWGGAARALFEGDPVAIVYPDGHELLIHPEEVHGLARLPLAVAAVLLKVRRGDLRDLMQLPPRTRIEARDSAKHAFMAITRPSREASGRAFSFTV